MSTNPERRPEERAFNNDDRGGNRDSVSGAIRRIGARQKVRDYLFFHDPFLMADGANANLQARKARLESERTALRDDAETAVNILRGHILDALLAGNAVTYDDAKRMADEDTRIDALDSKQLGDEFLSFMKTLRMFDLIIASPSHL